MNWPFLGCGSFAAAIELPPLTDHFIDFPFLFKVSDYFDFFAAVGDAAGGSSGM